MTTVTATARIFPDEGHGFIVCSDGTWRSRRFRSKELGRKELERGLTLGKYGEKGLDNARQVINASALPEQAPSHLVTDEEIQKEAIDPITDEVVQGFMDRYNG